MNPTRSRPSVALLALLGPAVLTLATLPAAAQTATLVADIDLGGPSFIYSSSPSHFSVAGGKLFFSAAAPGTGLELFASDGTPSGSELLGDLCPGLCASGPQPLGAFRGGALFLAYPEGTGMPALFRSDGTRRGTVRVAPEGEDPPMVLPPRDGRFYATLGGRLFFLGCTAISGCELWSSDGSDAGTRVVEDIAPGEGSATPYEVAALGGKVYYAVTRGASVPQELWAARGDGRGAVRVTTLASGIRLLTAAGGRLFFISQVTGRGDELWTSDGTAAGTRALTDLASPAALNGTRRLEALGGQLYFVADDGVHGAEVWASDGTPAGTRRVTDFSRSDAFVRSAKGYAPMAWTGNRLVFIAREGGDSYRLWSSQGTPATMAPLADAAVDGNVPLVTLGGRVLFMAQDALGRRELWASDGTPGGTAALSQGCSCRPADGRLTALGGAAFFAVTDAAGHLALWRTDGTPAGTRRFADPAAELPAARPIFPSDGTAAVMPLELAALGGEVYFAAGGPYGLELWASDGRRDGTRLAANLAADGAGSYPFQVLPLGERVLFTACDGSQRQVWASGGTPATTVPLDPGTQIPCGPYDDRVLAAAGGTAFFLRDEGAGEPQLWRSDGTPQGTALLARLAVQGLPAPAVLGSRIYFPFDARHVWASDGTPAGTGEAFALSAGTIEPRHLATAGGRLYFIVQGSVYWEVWASDSTPAGTRHLADLPASYVEPPGFTAVGGKVFFFAGSNEFKPVLWASDGTPAGTRPLDLAPAGLQLSSVAGLATLGGRLLLFARPAQGALELWSTDGTAAGTARLGSFRTGYPRASDDPEPAVLGGRLFFAADDGVHGRELWVSDGTAAGTALVRDIAPGPLGSGATALTAAGGRLFLAAYEPVHGAELWQSDGTAAGTRLVEDLAPGILSAQPRELAAAPGRLYFSADDGLHGYELWSLPLSGPAGCQPSATRLCLGGGRFAVDADWKDFQGRRGFGQAAALTADTGTFWFFDPANVEVFVKVLDGRGLNDHFWVFFGALSSVEYSLTVTDTQTGLTRRYFNPSGRLASVADTQGFGLLGAYSTTTRTVAAPPAVAGSAPVAATGVCEASATRLCLNGGRFAVEAAWKDFQGHQGAGQAVALTGDTGYFWFFDASNVEVVLKVLDGRPINGKFWLFYGALSNVEYTLTVTDVQTGAVRIYRNPSGRLASYADTGAF